jgi:hypothetical protein
MGKGDTRRRSQVPEEKVQSNWDRIFNKREEKMSRTKTENKSVWGKLRTAMSDLDNSIPDHVFDNEDEGQELADNISAVWDKIADLESYYAQYHLVKKDNKEE